MASINNTCYTVEGVVESFTAYPSGRAESFTVKDNSFKYSAYNITGGFNRSFARGGPIQEGLQVRLCYIGGSRGGLIVKIEVPLDN